MLHPRPSTSEKFSNPLLRISSSPTKDILLWFLHHWNRQENYKSVPLCQFKRQSCLLWLDWQGQKVLSPPLGSAPDKERPKMAMEPWSTAKWKHKPFQNRYTCHFHSTFVQFHRKSGVSQLAKHLSVRGLVPSRSVWRPFQALTQKRQTFGQCNQSVLPSASCSLCSSRAQQPMRSCWLGCGVSTVWDHWEKCSGAPEPRDEYHPCTVSSRPKPKISINWLKHMAPEVGLSSKARTTKAELPKVSGTFLGGARASSH